MRDFTPLENWHRPPSSDGSGQSGLPDDSDDSFGGRELQVLPWTRGVHDSCGPSLAGGAPGDGSGRSYAQALLARVGPSSWQLPAMDSTAGLGPARCTTEVLPPIAALQNRTPSVPVKEIVAVLESRAPQVAVSILGRVRSVLDGSATEGARDQVGLGALAGQVVQVAHGTLAAGDQVGLAPATRKDPEDTRSYPEPGKLVDEPPVTLVVIVGCEPPLDLCVLPAGRRVGVVPSTEDPTSAPAPRNGSVQVVPADGERLEEGVDRDVAIGVHGELPIGQPVLGALIPELHGPIISASTTEAMHVTTYTEASGQVPAQEDLQLVRQQRGESLDMQTVSPSGLDGVTAQESVAFTKLKWFCSSLMKKLAPPLLKEVQASYLRAEAEPFTPRRCTRGSKKMTESKSSKVSQAENVLMRALGLVPDDLDVDDVVVSELQNIFDSPLQDQHVRVIAALFGKEVPPTCALEKDMSSVVRAH